MPPKETAPLLCPVSATLQLIGGKYKALILWHLQDNAVRFSALQKVVPGATPKMLTQQLREMEKDGLLTRTVYPIVPPKVEYSLTKKGSSLRPILTAMFAWGTAHLEGSGLTPNCTMITQSPVCSCAMPAEQTKGDERK